MNVIVLNESGYSEAILGLALSHYIEGTPIEEFWTTKKVERMAKVAAKLSAKGGSHAKFLRTINIWAMVTAPRFWWPETDQYKVGLVTLSASTMHTLTKQPATQDNFCYPVLSASLDHLNDGIAGRIPIDEIKARLPEGYLQTRLCHMNYQTVRTMIAQRQTHRLPQWQEFLALLRGQVEHPELLESIRYE